MNQIPDVVRRATAYRYTLSSVLGFDLDRHTFVVFTQNISAAPALPAGHTYAAAVLSLAGHPDQSVEFCAVAGSLPLDDLTGLGERLIPAWNRLTQDQRNEERRRWVTWDDTQLMVRRLLERGVSIPSLEVLTLDAIVESGALVTLRHLYVN